jgi:hypothetical protein
MSKKGKKVRKESRKKAAVKVFKKTVTMRDKIQSVYASVELGTTCCRQCVCCMVSCPQMNQCEAATILDDIWTKWTKDDRKKFIVRCMKYFFGNSMVKPCPLLGRAQDGHPGCMAYSDRPLNCRLYGQWPEEAYEKRVQRFVEATGMKRTELPLNKQCAHVRNITGESPSAETIEALFEQLDVIDMVVFKYDRPMVEKKHNYRALHDWALVKYLGEDKLTTLSTFFKACTEEQAKDYLEKFESAIMEA